MTENRAPVSICLLTRMILAFLSDESGQGITEYGAIIAFVGMLIAILFGLTRGTLSKAVSQSFSSVVNQVGTLNSYSAASTS